MITRLNGIKKNHISLLSLAIFLAMTSCIDEYWPEITKYQNIIVVDGKITSDPGPYTVQLSFSTDVNLPQLHPYASCLVSIHDDEGNFENVILNKYFLNLSNFVYIF